MNILTRALLFTVLLFIGFEKGAHANELALGAPFSSQMVLQRDTIIPVWGTAPRGATIQVDLAGEEQTVEAAADGSWKVEFRPRSAAQDLNLSARSRTQKIELAGVSVGDVFLCSGQSNMEWRMSSTALSSSDRRLPIDSEIRLLTVPRNRSQVEQHQFGEVASWKSAADGSEDFSAVCLLAGREIASRENVIVGLVNSSHGGSPIQAWLPYEGLVALGAMDKQIEILDAYKRDPVSAEREFGETVEDLWNLRPSPIRTRRAREGYANLFNGMIAPLGPMQLSGVVWYQGESNANDGLGTSIYQRQLATLLESWRARIGARVPFVIVQLASYGKLSGEPGQDNWAEVREAQRLVARNDRDAELVVTIDIGERLDIHPPLKKPVGQRVAMALRKLVYGDLKAYPSPQVISAKRDRRKLNVSISSAEKPLFAASWGRPGPFMVCRASDRDHCQFADAEFTEKGISVGIPDNWQNVVVRYCWGAAPLCNVFSTSDLPLGPFELLAK